MEKESQGSVTLRYEPSLGARYGGRCWGVYLEGREEVFVVGGHVCEIMRWAREYGFEVKKDDASKTTGSVGPCQGSGIA